MEQRSSKSYLAFIGAMLIWGTIGIFRRSVPLSSSVLACSRGLLGAVSLFLYLKLSGKKVRSGMSKKSFVLLALAGGLIGFNWILLFEAYNYTTIATATLCYYMEPTIVILLSAPLLREKLTPKKALCAVTAFVGMVFVSGILENRSAGVSDFRGVLLGLGSAALYASVTLLNKRIREGDGYERTVIQLFFSFAVVLPYVLLTEDLGGISLSPSSWLLVLFIGLFHTGFAYALYFGSMKKMPAQSIAVLSYIDPVSALILSAVFLSEPMTVLAMIGAVLIIGSALVSERSFSKK